LFFPKNPGFNSCTTFKPGSSSVFINHNPQL
jgi:hypothetical protein